MTDADDRVDLWLFVTALSVGGAEKTLVDLANDLDPDAYDVTVWTIFEQNPLADRLTEHVTLRTLGVAGVTSADHAFAVERAADPLDYARAPLRFVRAVRRERPDIVQSFLTNDNILARAAGALAPDTILITGVRLVPTGERDVSQRIDNWTSRFADHVVSNSAAGARFVRNHGVPADRVSVIHNGRDLSRFDRDSPKSLRDDLGLPQDASVVGIVARLIDRKGHAELLDAWRTVRREVPDARLLVVGDGPERASLEARARDLGVSESVHFLGLRDDVPDLLALMDAFAFPSHYEGLPGALLEAMAAGLPCVATPVDGNSELLTAYETGLFVGVNEPDALAWALVRVLRNDALAESLGDAAAERARDAFSLDRMTAAFDALYRRLLREHSTGRTT